ncbi:MAG: uracil phosphoribosyltransferase [Bacteroidales bacterium]|nr:uracil phosphoribosyltransferase [Bacteroidales bacterium]MDT8372682.1 uracil phosphoribosyltransferase [Bacteroidales bacterium]
MLKLINHPLITHKLAHIRRKETGTRDFRQNLSEIAGLMAYEITRDIPLREITVETPVGSCETAELSREIILVPVLRAGLGMVDGITSLITTAKVGHIGLIRDHETLEPTEYFAKFPSDLSEAIVMVLDPMLATGGSASAAIAAIRKRGAKTIRLVCIVGAPEGVARVEEEHPDVDIYLTALDSHLNERGYIVPGLGDAGDRLFGTL